MPKRLLNLLPRELFNEVFILLSDKQYYISINGQVKICKCGYCSTGGECLT